MATPMVAPMMPTIVVVVGSLQERNSDQERQQKSCAARRSSFGPLTAPSGPEVRSVYRVINFHIKALQSETDKEIPKTLSVRERLLLAQSRHSQRVRQTSRRRDRPECAPKRCGAKLRRFQ
jgi:hypothetical protein